MTALTDRFEKARQAELKKPETELKNLTTYLNLKGWAGSGYPFPVSALCG